MGWDLLFVFGPLLKNEQLLWIKKQKYFLTARDKDHPNASWLLSSYHSCFS